MMSHLTYMVDLAPSGLMIVRRDGVVEHYARHHARAWTSGFDAWEVEVDPTGHATVYLTRRLLDKYNAGEPFDAEWRGLRLVYRP